MSSIGRACIAASRAASATVSSVRVRPTRYASASGARTTVGATAPRAIAACVISPSRQLLPPFPTASEPATLRTLIACAAAQPQLDEVARPYTVCQRNRDTREHLVGGEIDLPHAAKELRQRQRAAAPFCALNAHALHPAPAAARSCRWPDLAVTRLPAMVARLRICGAPTSQQARASGNACSTINGLRTHWLWVTRGPRCNAPPSSQISAMPGMRVRSIRPNRALSGLPSRARSISRSVPPAIKQAAAPCSAFNLRASASLFGDS